MKYLIIIFLSVLSFHSNAQKIGNYSIDSKTIPCIDSINYTDQNELKQGIWTGFIHEIGNCNDYTINNYTYFYNNKPKFEISILLDSNTCYPPQDLFKCTIYDEDENILFTLKNISPQPIINFNSKEVITDLYSMANLPVYIKDVFINNLVYENEQVKYDVLNLNRLFFRTELILGEYCEYIDGKPGERFSVE